MSAVCLAGKSENMESSSTCRFCGSSDITPFCRRTDVDLHGSYDFCRSCLVYFANPMASDEALAVYYSTYYTSADTKEGARHRLDDAQRHRGMYDEFSRTTLKAIRAAVPAGRYLEIGCGEGARLAAARDAGYQAMGIDLAPNAVAVAQRIFQLDAKAIRLEDLDEPDGSFDVIYSWHTIEHVTDLRGFLSECSRLLKTGGWLFIGTENPDAIFHRIYAMLHRLSGVPVPLNSSSSEHTYLLSPRFIRRHFPEFGLHPTRVRSYEQFDWVVRRMQSPRLVKRAVKWVGWGGLALAAHLLNSGVLLSVQARKAA